MAILLFLTGCMTDNPPQIIGMPRLHGGFLQETIAEEREEKGPREYTVFFKRGNERPAMYEPNEGAYIGAWLSPEASIRIFEHQAGKRHTVFVHEINLGDEVPVTWLLHCIASQATPLFVVYPPNDSDLLDIPPIELAAELAEQLGSFNLPMFIAFYPAKPEIHGLMPAEYSKLFSQSRNIFKAYAPMAAFVWAAPCHTATPKNPFFPGHNNIDWVALSLLAHWDTVNGYTDILANFEMFYTSFNEHAPLMILPLGISHFTRGDYTYRLSQAASEITRIYKALRSFPRLGLVAYGDAFTIVHSYSDDFSVSIEAELISAYAEAVACGNYLQSLHRNSNETERWVRSLHGGYVWEDRIYIPTELFENEFNHSAPRNAVTINNKTFVESRRIPDKDIYLCDERRVIFIN
jgi:hypothetical protein